MANVTNRGRFLPRFPATVSGSGFVTRTQSGLTYTFGADFRPLSAESVSIDQTALTVVQNATTGTFSKISIADLRGISPSPDEASQAEAEAGAVTGVFMSPLGVKQNIDARLATQASAEAGTAVTGLMNELRTKQAIYALSTSTPVKSIADYGALPAQANNILTALTNGNTAADGGDLIIPIGQWRLDANYTSASPIALVGRATGAGPGTVANTRASQIVANFTTGDMITAGPSVYGSRFENLQFTANAQRTGGAAIRLVGVSGTSTVSHYVIDNVSFNSQNVGIQLEIPGWGIIERTYHQAFKRAAIFSRGDSLNEPIGGVWTRNYIFGTRTVATTVENGIETYHGYYRAQSNQIVGCAVAIRTIVGDFNAGGIEILDNTIEDQTIAGVYIERTGTTAVAALVAISRNETAHTTFDATSGYTAFQGGFMLVAGTANWVTTVQVNENRWRSSINKPGAAAFDIQTGKDVQIHGNNLEGLASNTIVGIRVESQAENVQVFDNIIRGTWGTKYVLTAQCTLRDFGSELTLAEVNAITCKDGSTVWCVDAVPGSSPAAGSGSGAVLVRQGGAWHGLDMRTDVAHIQTTDADTTFTAANIPSYIIYEAPLAADRSITLPTSGIPVGKIVRVQRDTTATGAFNLGIQGLHGLSAGIFTDVMWTGSTWRRIRYGAV